ncbi:MAG: stage V sporulation protein AC [Sarcina sp.]
MVKYKGDEQIKKSFKKLSEEDKPEPKVFKNCIRAFIIGGLICVLGQFIKNILLKYGISEEHVSSLVPIILVFLGALLTGLGWYDKIAEFAGAGTVVPITGFSNSIVSPAIEFKKEGFVMGVGAKMFTIAGPVLVYGIGTSVIVGIIYYVLMYFKIVG